MLCRLFLLILQFFSNSVVVGLLYCHFLCSKLHDLVPEEEMDLLTTEETWKPLRDLDEVSEDASSVQVDADTTGKR